MPRQNRLEFKGAVYHVINRGNYRTDVFASQGAKHAFLKALDETASKLNWRVHGWTIMSNHYHLALETPEGNLVEGMKHWQGTFATRFNRMRDERGHIFQGRYKSLLVAEGRLGSLCHYIHLNPVRARICSVEELKQWPWTSLHWMSKPKKRPSWYTPEAALAHAGDLADTSVGHRHYYKYLAWLGANTEAQREMLFAKMCKGWVIGTVDDKKKVVADQLNLQPLSASSGLRDSQEALWQAEVEQLLRRLRRTRQDLMDSPKSVEWKRAVALVMKTNTTATNRWLGEALAMGSLHEVSRQVSAWARAPDEKLLKRLSPTTNNKA